MQNRISNLIKINGFIAVNDFIFTCLYHPTEGYYCNQNPIQKDFTTSPEISNAFGIILANYIFTHLQNHEADEIHLIEMGGGSGKLSYDILSFLFSLNKLNNEKINSIIKKINFHSIEISNKLKLIQKNKLINFENKKYFWNNISELFSFFENSKINKNNYFVFYSNEFFDALPIKQFYFNQEDFFELIITEKNNNFIFEKLKINSEQLNLINLKNQKYKNNSIIEIPVTGKLIAKQISQFMQKNPSLFITFDYGTPNPTFQSTLQGIFNGKKTTDILQNCGKTDITHLVDFSPYQNIFQNAGMQTQIQTQGSFLIENGIESLINQQNQKGISRLISPNQMGELFKVLIAKN